MLLRSGLAGHHVRREGCWERIEMAGMLTLRLGNVLAQELQALGDALGTVSKGVPQAAVDALPRSQYSLPSAAAAAPGKRSGSRRKGVRSPTATLEPDKCTPTWPCPEQPLRGCTLRSLSGTLAGSQVVMRFSTPARLMN